MRWDELFADLEAQAEAEERAELAAEVADRARREAARLRLVDRFRGAQAVGRTLGIGVRGSGLIRGQVRAVGSDWLLVDDGERETLVSVSAVDDVVGLGPESAEPGSEGAVSARLGLGHPLRALARDRAEVRVHTQGGAVLTGTIDRVGADHLELAEHPAGESRVGRTSRLVAFASLASLQVRGS